MTDSRKTAQIETIEGNVEAIRSNLPKVRELAEERKNALVTLSVDVLQLCVDSLDVALTDDQLMAMPVPALTQVAKSSTNAASVTTNMVGNFEGEAGNFTNQVDSLHNRLWADRLISPIEEVAAHRRAVGQLDASIGVVRELVEELQAARQHEESAQAAAIKAAELSESAAAKFEEVAALEIKASEAAKQTEHYQGESEGYADESEVSLAKVKESEAAITAIRADLNKWHSEIESTREAIETLNTSTEKRLEEHDADIDERFKTLDGFDKRIREQFELASSGALAESFSRRGRGLFWGKLGWGAIALFSYFGFVGFAVWVMVETLGEMPSQALGGVSNQASSEVHSEWPKFWATFGARVWVAVPIGLLVWFTTKQFGQARRVQESYAFKGAVASSFDAYRDLVAKIATDATLKADPEYAKFIRETIARIYAVPPMGGESDDEPPHTRALKEIPGVIKALTDLVDRARRP